VAAECPRPEPLPPDPAEIVDALSVSVSEGATFRSSGDHLRGCGANRVRALGTRCEETVVVSNSEAGSFVAIGSVGPELHLFVM
jgi:hypothetical protein